MIVLPVYNDWDACRQVICRVDAVLKADGRRGRFLVVDDGSNAPPDLNQVIPELRSTESLDVLSLRRNLGHQRAICVALCVIERDFPCEGVIIMDADGEDDPDDLPRLLGKWEEEGKAPIVFAERTRRSEGLLFRVSYWTYRVVHRILTGRGVRVGNFSVVPATKLSSLVAYPELWSHYAAAVFVSRIPFVTVPTRRGRRLAGQTSMDFQGLVAHGLSAVTVFSETVGVRVLLAALVVVGATGLGLVGVFTAGLVLPWEIPPWTVYSAGLLAVVMLLSIMFAFLFTFIILFERKSGSMIPVRDAWLFASGVTRLIPGAGSGNASNRAGSQGP